MNPNEDVTEELYYCFPRHSVVLYGINNPYQADLVKITPYTNTRGFKCILFVINAFIKYI